MIKRHFFLVAAAVLVGLMVIAGVLKIAFAGDEGGGPGGPGGGRGGGQLVSQVTVTPHEFSDHIEVLGVARGRRSVDITSATTELITRVMFRDGQYVAAGAPLVELQAREEEAGIIQARAEVEQARRDMERWESLAERGIAPRVTAEQARTTFELAQASLEAAQARRGDRIIRAPFAGVLGLSTVTAGTLINPGAVIATLDDIGVIRVDFPVPERYLSTLSEGAPIVATFTRAKEAFLHADMLAKGVHVTAGGAIIPAFAEIAPDVVGRASMIVVDNIEQCQENARELNDAVATADAFPGQQFSGRISQLDTRVNEQTRAVTARAEFANPGGRIRPGMAMRVSVEQGRRTALSVPESAVQYEGDSAFVYRIASQGEGASIAQRVTVETGAVEDGFVEILSGVAANNRVVGSGLNRIQPGAPVRVEKAGRPAPAAAAAGVGAP